MVNARSRAAMERGAAADLWRNTLAQIPSIFGRLVYLSSLRDSNTGRYEHHGLALMFDEREADQALRLSHEQMFDAWLGFNLHDQKADLDLYLSELSNDRKTIVGTWLRLAPYRTLIPAAAASVEADLYLCDFAILLELLRNDYGVAAPDEDA